MPKSTLKEHLMHFLDHLSKEKPSPYSSSSSNKIITSTHHVDKLCMSHDHALRKCLIIDSFVWWSSFGMWLIMLSSLQWSCFQFSMIMLLKGIFFYPY